MPNSAASSCSSTGDVGQPSSTEGFAFHGQSTSLVVGDADSMGVVRGAQDAVLLEQILNDVLLLAVDPTPEKKHKKGERLRQGIHERMLDVPGWNQARSARFCRVAAVRARDASRWRRSEAFRQSRLGRNFAQAAVLAVHGQQPVPLAEVVSAIERQVRNTQARRAEAQFFQPGCPVHYNRPLEAFVGLAHEPVP